MEGGVTVCIEFRTRRNLALGERLGLDEDPTSGNLVALVRECVATLLSCLSKGDGVFCKKRSSSKEARRSRFSLCRLSGVIIAW